LTIVTEGTRPSSQEMCHAVTIQLNTLSSLTKEQRRSKENSSDSRITRHGSSMEDARLASSYGVTPVRFKLRSWQGKSWGDKNFELSTHRMSWRWNRQSVDTAGFFIRKKDEENIHLYLCLSRIVLKTISI